VQLKFSDKVKTNFHILIANAAKFIIKDKRLYFQ